METEKEKEKESCKLLQEEESHTYASKLSHMKSESVIIS